MFNNESLQLPDALKDKPRVAFLNDYVESLLAAIRDVNHHAKHSEVINDCFFIKRLVNPECRVCRSGSWIVSV